jgi:hypothetical protein
VWISAGLLGAQLVDDLAELAHRAIEIEDLNRRARLA